MKKCFSSLLATALLAVAGGCHLSSSATYLVAVGARDKLPTWQGGCNTSTARPSGHIEFDTNSRYTAKAPGSVTITCAKGNLVLDVREVATLVIDGPDELSVDGGFGSFQVRAMDRSGQELNVGHYADVEWTTTPNVDRGVDGCSGDILPVCLGSGSVRLRGVAGSRGEVTVTFAGKTQTKKLLLR